MKLESISLFETEGNYTKVFHEDKCPLLHKSLILIEKRLDENHFIRVKRQQIININHVKNIESWFKGKLKLTLSNGLKVEVSERQSVVLKRKWGI